MWPSIAIVFPSPEVRDSPVCDVDAGVHGHHRQFCCSCFLSFVLWLTASEIGCRIVNP